MFFIYQITNKVNGHSYVGFTSKRLAIRWSHHKCAARRGTVGVLNCAIRKYGIENFSIVVLEEGWTPQIGLTIREPYWISVLRPEYNITQGGEGNLGLVHTTETKKKMSLSALSNPKSMAHIRKLGHDYYSRNCRRGISEETKELLRKRFSGKPTEKLTCPHCGLTGGCGPIRQWHFDNCKFKTPSIANEISNEILELRKSGYTHAEIYKKIGEGKKRTERVGSKKVGQILREGGAAFTIFITCPHCNKTGGARGMTRWHLDNCKLKDTGRLEL